MRWRRNELTFSLIAFSYMLSSAFFVFAFVIILDERGLRRYQIGLATSYLVAFVVKPIRMVVNHYGVLVLVRQGRQKVRRGVLRTWQEIRAARLLAQAPGIADFSYEPAWMGNSQGDILRESEAALGSMEAWVEQRDLELRIEEDESASADAVDLELLDGPDIALPVTEDTSGPAQSERAPMVSVRCVVAPTNCGVDEAACRFQEPAFCSPLTSLPCDNELLVEVTDSEVRPRGSQFFAV
jgi:hypothetical protein